MVDKKSAPSTDSQPKAEESAEAAGGKKAAKKPGGFNDKFLRAPKVKPPPPKMMRGRGANRGR